MTLFLTILLFILIFGLIIFLHEGGHFLMARREGMKVKEFAFGFPPRLFSTRWLDTKFSLNLFPLGGYVSILGEDEDNESPDSFSKKSPWSRLRVVLAGVAMNVVLAWVLLTVWFWVLPFSPNVDAIAVASVREGSAAEQADIRVNDFIVRAGETKFKTDDELVAFTREHKGEQLEFLVRRNGNEITVPVTLGSGDGPPLGVSLADVGEQPVGVVWWQAPWFALLEIANVTLTTFGFIGGAIAKLFGGGQDVALDSVSGPVGIFTFLQQTMILGAPFLLRFTALISLAVGIFNVLPFPALDGGRAIFLAFEGITGKRAISHEKEAWIHAAGFALLILMIIVVTYFDIKKL